MSEKVIGSHLFGDDNKSQSSSSSFSGGDNSNNNDWFSQDSPTPASNNNNSNNNSSSSYMNNNSNSYSNNQQSSNSGNNQFYPPTSNSNSNANSSANSNSNSDSNSYNNNQMNSNSSSSSQQQFNPTNQNQPEDYSNEPPLLEELGVHIPHILQKTKSVLTPFSHYDASSGPDHLMDSTDLAGPLCFCLLLGFSLLLTGKIHFGYIYGFGVFGCLAMSTLVNLISPQPIDTWRTFSILGYCLLPVNFLSVLAIGVRLDGYFGAAVGVITIGWCTAASTRLFERSCAMREQRWLIAYPTALLYSCFVLITVF